MLTRYGQLNVALLFAGDLVSLTVSWLLAYWLRFYSGIAPVLRGHAPVSDYLFLLPFVWLAWLLASQWTHLYDHRVGMKGTEEVGRLTRAIGGAVLMLIAMTFFYREKSYSRVMMLFFMVVGTVLLFYTRRLVWSLIRRLRRRGFDVRRILVIGTSPLAARAASLLDAYRYLGFRVVGHLAETDGAGERLEERPVVGRLEEAREVVEREGVHEVYVVLPPEHRERQDRLLDALADSSVDIRVIPDLVDRMRLNAGIEELAGLPVILLSQTPLLGWNRAVKRAMDVVLGSAALVLLSPLLLVIAALVKLTSRGPILYRQERMGLDGVQFRMYKFRSMRVGAERETGPVWAQPDDERRTAVGRFLRRLSLDELPQLFNVLAGDMSLVGPRPERPVFVEEFRRSVPGYMLRHKMKSGITGWAQVNGWRGDTSIEKRIEFDLYYIENWSIWFDLKILWLTVWKGFVNKNAY